MNGVLLNVSTGFGAAWRPWYLGCPLSYSREPGGKPSPCKRKVELVDASSKDGRSDGALEAVLPTAGGPEGTPGSGEVWGRCAHCRQDVRPMRCFMVDVLLADDTGSMWVRAWGKTAEVSLIHRPPIVV